MSCMPPKVVNVPTNRYELPPSMPVNLVSLPQFGGGDPFLLPVLHVARRATSSLTWQFSPKAKNAVFLSRCASLQRICIKLTNLPSTLCCHPPPPKKKKQGTPKTPRDTQNSANSHNGKQSPFGLPVPPPPSAICLPNPFCSQKITNNKHKPKKGKRRTNKTLGDAGFAAVVSDPRRLLTDRPTSRLRSFAPAPP